MGSETDGKVMGKHGTDNRRQKKVINGGENKVESWAVKWEIKEGRYEGGREEDKEGKR